MHTEIKKLLIQAATNKASDIHLSVGKMPMFRINGELLVATGFPQFSELEYTQAIMSLASLDVQQKIESQREFDFSVELAEDELRFRVNAYYSRSKLAAVLRLIPQNIPSMEDLGIPKNVIDFLKGKQGFVLVTGPTGSGKSTSLAAMLQFINQNTSSHIVTVEDPVEYLLKPVKSTIDQREVFSDTMSFASALKSTLRQDPNVVLVGEMRDLETISSAITVAETGHLVFSTLHTNSASQSVDRIIDVFPENSQSQIRSQFASILSLVVSQRLLPAINGGRVAAFEIMVATSAVKNAIREGKTFMIDNMIQTGLEVGMLPLEMSLAKLVIDGKVDEGVAMSFALRPGELQQQLRSFKLHAKV